jgi:hypothetical protein
MKATQNLLVLLAFASVHATVAAPMPVDGNQPIKRDAEPEAKPDYGSYGSYGTYPSTSSGSASGYGSYGSYPEPAGGYGTYASYGTYKRFIGNLIKRIWS